MHQIQPRFVEKSAAICVEQPRCPNPDEILPDRHTRFGNPTIFSSLGTPFSRGARTQPQPVRFPFRKKAQPCQHATGELDVTPHQHIARQPQPYPFRWAGSGSPAPSCMVWLLAIEQNHDMVRPVRFGVSRVSGKMQRLHFFKVSVYFMCTYTCMYVFMCMCESGL